MRIHEIKESIDDMDLSSKQYHRLISDLKHELTGDRNARQAKDQVMDMWAKGDKLVGNYKSIIKDLKTNII